jgi:hypothetical protein
MRWCRVYGEHILWRTHSIDRHQLISCLSSRENTFYGEHILVIRTHSIDRHQLISCLSSRENTFYGEHILVIRTHSIDTEGAHKKGTEHRRGFRVLRFRV